MSARTGPHDTGAARVAAIRARLAKISGGGWEPHPHVHHASGCRCLSCDDPVVGWSVSHDGALDCDELVAARSNAGEVNSFRRPLTSCDHGPLLTYDDADFAAHAPDDIRFLLDLLDGAVPHRPPAASPPAPKEPT